LQIACGITFFIEQYYVRPNKFSLRCLKLEVTYIICQVNFHIDLAKGRKTLKMYTFKFELGAN